MNLYVLFKNNSGFLNIQPSNPLDKFEYYCLNDNTKERHSGSFSTYKDKMINDPSTHHVHSYLFTTASTPDELYSLHPELFI